jgi:hypothetical protein
MSVDFPLPPAWLQERRTSGGWKSLRDDLISYANSCPGGQQLAQLSLALEEHLRLD